MRRSEKQAVAAAGAVFDRFGWPFRAERRNRHLILIVTPPDGVAVNIIISPRRDAANLAVFHARRLLTKHGVKP